MFNLYLILGTLCFGSGVGFSTAFYALKRKLTKLSLATIIILFVGTAIFFFMAGKLSI